MFLKRRENNYERFNMITYRIQQIKSMNFAKTTFLSMVMLRLMTRLEKVLELKAKALSIVICINY